MTAPTTDTAFSPAALLERDSHLSIRNGHLWMEDCDTVELARRFGTPLFVISETQLRRRYREFAVSFAAAWPEGSTHILTAIKANHCFALRRILTEEGAGCDTFGEGEFRIALTCGVPPELISVNGSCKSAGLIEQAVAAGARVTLDSAREYELTEATAKRLGKPALVRFRVKPPFSDMDMFTQLSPEPVTVRDAMFRYKPGIAPETLMRLAPLALASDHIDLRGFHYHIGRHITAVELWTMAIRSFVDVVADVCELLDGWQPKEVDVGGGFAPYRDFVAGLWPKAPQTHVEEIPTVADYARAVADTMRSAFETRGLSTDGVTLEAEPGRSVLANAGIHLANVSNVKHQHEPRDWCWIELDTSEVFIPDLREEGWRWPVIFANRADATCTEVADVVGLTCQYDMIVPDAKVPLGVAEGDVVAFVDTGAYNEVATSNFNALPRPATVLVHGAEAEIVKRRETYTDVFARDVIPERLS
jgi:diaminopimelate decarboxylase